MSMSDGLPDLEALAAFLTTDPRDVGCEQAMAVLHVYAELPARERTRRMPGVEAHLRACGPCDDDFHGLLAALSQSVPQSPPVQ